MRILNSFLFRLLLSNMNYNVKCRHNILQCYEINNTEYDIRTKVRNFEE